MIMIIKIPLGPYPHSRLYSQLGKAAINMIIRIMSSINPIIIYLFESILHLSININAKSSHLEISQMNLKQNKQFDVFVKESTFI